MTATTALSNDERQTIDLNLQHGHKDLVQAVAFNTYGDRCATGSVDGKIRVFNRHKDATWRLCDTWSAHGGEVLELQWLPATVYPNLIASLGMEGWFRLWAEDPSAAPGRRFCSGRSSGGRPAFDTRSGRPAPYRSFSVKHCDDSRHTYLALLATDGRLTVLDNDQPENLSEYSSLDEFAVCSKPARGEEVSFRLRFDPNPEPCYAALRAGVAPDGLALVVASMDTVSIYRSRDVLASAYGLSQTRKEFYLAAQVAGHRGLVRDVAWAPGNFRGYDIIATACQDGFARVFRLDTPVDQAEGKSWSAAELLAKPSPPGGNSDADPATSTTTTTDIEKPHPPSSTLSASLAAKSGSHAHHQHQHHHHHHHHHHHRLLASAQPGQVKHQVCEISRLDSHRTPVWRVAFDDDGQILGSTGDDGKLLCYRQTPDGSWVKSSELVMIKARMAAP